MKNAIIVILTLCLIVSLWINRNDRKEMRDAMKRMQGTAEAAGAAAGGQDSAGGRTATDPGPRNLMPKAPPTMDFSGTAFDDESWKLDNKNKTGTAPTALPSSTLGDGDSPLGSIPEAPAQEPGGGSGQVKKSPFNSVLTR